MPIASEITTWVETPPAPRDGTPARLRSRVRTNASPERFERRLARLGLLALAERVGRSDPTWYWTGTGRGYEILWREAVTIADLLALARL